MNEAQHPIQLVARLTGLSAHVIRIWEQRYRAVEPQRTATKRRLYSGVFVLFEALRGWCVLRACGIKTRL